MIIIDLTKQAIHTKKRLTKKSFKLYNLVYICNNKNREE